MKTREDKRMIRLDFLFFFQKCPFEHIFRKINTFTFGTWSFLLIHIRFTPSEGPKDPLFFLFLLNEPWKLVLQGGPWKKVIFHGPTSWFMVWTGLNNPTEIGLKQKLKHYEENGHGHNLDFLRAALHLEAGPIRCVRGLKSSLVIGQKAQIGPELVELGAPKMEKQFLASRRMSYFTKKTFLNKVWFFLAN
jgi:hypothetical protein